MNEAENVVVCRRRRCPSQCFYVEERRIDDEEKEKMQESP